MYEYLKIMKYCLKISIFLIMIIVLILFFMYLNICINPKIVDLTKYETLDFIRDDTPYFFLIDKNKNNNAVLDNLEYPYVFKPNYCEDFSHQVEIIKNVDQAKEYLKKSIDDYIIIQKYYPGPYEGTVYYTKHPVTKNVRIIVVERQQNSDKKEWLWKASIGYKYGYTTRHRPELETPELKKKIIEISEKLPEFFLGRYDLRFEDHQSFAQGKNFKVLEINGQGAADTRYNVDNTFLYNIMIFARYIAIHIEFGLLNILMGNVVELKVFIYMVYKYFTKPSECQQSDKIKNIFLKLFKSFSII